MERTGANIKRIAGLAVATLLFLSMISTGVWAYFSDAVGARATLTAGTLDLKTNDADGVTETLFNDAMIPGVTVGPSTIVLRNSGSLAGSVLDIVFDYTASNLPPASKTADETAAVIEVTELAYDGTDLLTAVPDANENGWKDLQDVKNVNLTGLAGLAASESKDFVISVRLHSDVSAEFDGAGINVTMTFILRQ